MKKLVEVSITILVDETDDEQVVADTVNNTLPAYYYGWEVTQILVTHSEETNME